MKIAIRSNTTSFLSGGCGLAGFLPVRKGLAAVAVCQLYVTFVSSVFLFRLLSQSDREKEDENSQRESWRGGLRTVDCQFILVFLVLVWNKILYLAWAPQFFSYRSLILLTIAGYASKKDHWWNWAPGQMAGWCKWQPISHFHEEGR